MAKRDIVIEIVIYPLVIVHLIKTVTAIKIKIENTHHLLVTIHHHLLVITLPHPIHHHKKTILLKNSELSTSHN